MTPNLLTVQNLQKTYPVKVDIFGKVVSAVHAVNGVDLSVRRGETMGLVGESGCGKTTLGRCILRLEEPTGGRIHFDGHDLNGMTTRNLRRVRRDMQMIFQDPYSSLNPRKTVGKIITDAYAIHRMFPGPERSAKVRELMAIVGLRPDAYNRYPHEFSGGQRQRIGVARAIALRPKLVVADEPVSALDVSIQAQIVNLLVTLQQELKLTYLFISHDLGVVRHISDRIAVMYLGRIVELTDSGSLFDAPFHPYTEALLSALPVPDRQRAKRRVSLTGDVPSPMTPPSGCPFHPRCRYHKDRCVHERPEFRAIADGRSVACHFPVNTGRLG
ncbi:MAG: dipeptide ABC transporter ATP-binding protein [Desulfobacterales bacterium]|jgi:oligopeptide/dipeptide ABC transporter ATP-binding protein